MDNVQHVTDILAERWPVISAALTACALAFLLPALLRAMRLWSIPSIGEELGGTEKRRLAYLTGAKKLYNDGYQKFKGGVFQITTSKKSSSIVLSPEFLPELRKLSDDVVSFDEAIKESMETKYTKIETGVRIIPHTVKADLTPALSRINSTIAAEVDEALEMELPACQDWTDVNINQALLRIVARVSGRVFIGPELCHNEEYLDAAINYTVDVMSAQGAVHRMRPWLRPILASRLAPVKRLAERIKQAHRFMDPVVKQRREAALDPEYQKPDDMLQWLLDAQDKFPDKNSQNLAKVQLGISFAAIHTTTLTATNVFFNIAALPELVPELREEIKQALADNDGAFTSNALQSMKKMDSLLKETLRFHPMSQGSFQRKVMKSFTLSSGQVIPAGVIIEVPSGAISADPNVFPDPDKFDPLRFYHLRQQAKAAGSAEGGAVNQFVSVSQSGLTFGYGRHACPGRFFAANEIKMIIANAIMKFDFKLAGGHTERYPNIEFGNMSVPDASKSVMFKAVAV